MAKVLVIDDSDAVRSMIRKALESSGYHVCEACDGEQGLAAIQRETPDLVVTDIVMPESEGIQMILELRRRKTKMPVVAISGGGTGWAMDYLRVAMASGAIASLTKPFTAQEIIDAVRKGLETRTEFFTNGTAPSIV
jgi:DNA-binding NtrC family response regulator